MYNLFSTELNFKIGIVKELYAKGLITETQMKKAIDILIKNETENLKKTKGD
jgi:hypothetical protein